MLHNYLITAWRNIRKSHSFTWINIIGLAFGMAVCMLVLQYVGFELSYDNFHAKKDRIYRVGINFNRPDWQSQWVRTGTGLIKLQHDFPEVEKLVRLVNLWEVILSYEPTHGQVVHHKEKGIFYADSTLFEVFDFALLQGNPAKVLREKNRMIISQSAATKWFGRENPLGKTLILKEEEAFVIEGVVEDLPKNSHIHFDYLLSFVSLKNSKERPLDEEIAYLGTYVYLLLQKGVDREEFLQKINTRFDQYYDYLHKAWGEWTGSFFLQPIEEIQTTTGLYDEVAARQNPDKLYSLGLVGILILLMAWINYINLATVRSVERSKEVGIRKATGATRNQLISQFLMEAMVLNAVAFLLALCMVALSQDYFSQITGWTESSSLWQMPSFWITLFLSFLIGSLLSGLYPAFVLTAYRPVKALKGGYQSSVGGKNLRKLLSVVQYAASVSLLIGTFIIYRQMSFLQHQDLGFDMEQIFVVKVPSQGEVTEAAHEAFRQKVMVIPGVNDFTFTSRIFGTEVGNIEGGVLHLRQEMDTISPVSFATFGGVDYNFLEFYDIKLKAGRFFQPDSPSDRTAYVISESAVKKLIYEAQKAGHVYDGDVLGQTLGIHHHYLPENFSEHEYEGRIIGVIEDVDLIAPNMRGPDARRGGIALTLGDYLFDKLRPQYYSLKVDMAHWQQTEAKIKEAFQQVYPDELYEYFFQDEFYNRQYQADLQFLNLFVFFALQAIVIACLGLFGLAAFQVRKRRKEIGIRKVLGANMADIWLLLAKDLLKALLIASLIGIPVANYFMKSWLEEFIYKIPLTWWMFVLPVVLMTLIALLTVSQHLRKAGKLNPVKLLRYE